MPKIYLDKEAPGRYRATMRTRNGKVTALATVTFPNRVLTVRKYGLQPSTGSRPLPTNSQRRRLRSNNQSAPDAVAVELVSPTRSVQGTIRIRLDQDFGRLPLLARELMRDDPAPNSKASSVPGKGTWVIDI